MRRAISLYLGGVRADVDTDGLVLMNYALTDITNPTIVRNSWSQEVTLPGTPTNNRIFGESFRVDRNAGTGGEGVAFNASKRLPFTIYTAAGEILVSGYAKLNGVTGGAVPSYKVGLFGGLGDMLYSLAYDSAGNKRTLASLDFGGGDSELDFVIDKTAVADAWEMLKNGYLLVPSNNRVTKSLIDTSGNLYPTSNARYFVDEFTITSGGGNPAKITCRNVASSAYSAGAAYDSNGVVLAKWSFPLNNTNYTDADVTIPAGAVLVRLQGDTNAGLTPGIKSIIRKFDIINFAPCYNGIPDKDFSADKSIAVAADLGLTAPVGGYDTQSGKTLISLPDKVDEWAAKDLRSYLQRPVLNVWKMLQAISSDASSNGWTLDLSDIDTTAKWPYRDIWLTRPLLPFLGTYKSAPVSGASAALNSLGWSATNPFGQFLVTGAPLGAELEVAMSFTFGLMCPGATAATMLPWYEIPGGIVNQVLFAQAVAYDSSNTKVAAGKVKAFYHSYQSVSPSDIAEAVGYTPDSLNTDFDSPSGASGYTLDSASRYFRDRAIELSVKGVNIARVDIVIRPYVVTIPSGGGIVPGPAGGVLYDGGTAYQPTLAAVPTGTAGVTGATADTLRSGAHITKQMLLSTSGTPADYLLAICKSFGLYLLTDTGGKVVSVLRRGSFYQNTQTDLSPRVDLAHTPEIVPIPFDAKWYDFKQGSVGGRFEKEYQDTEGVQYGIERVDTGYDFDSNEKDLLSGSVLKSCAAVTDRSRYWYYIVQGGDYKPSPFLDPGCKYTLWDSGGESQEQDISVPGSTAVITEYNPAFPGYDIVTRPEFRSGDNKGVDGADVLLFFNYATNFAHFNLTDDTPEMDTINGGPCWIFAPNAGGLDIPQFTRYEWTGQAILRMLDFGYPREVDIPDATFDGPSLYESAWQLYIRDRLSVHGKILRCRVDFSGLKVGPELFRRFWWWRGSLWVLNSISNYSLTTYDPAECEFVQVRDTSAYLNGQY